MKISFSESNKALWGELQARVSEALLNGLRSGKSFYVQFGADKTPSQLRGFFRICDQLSPYMEDSFGVFFDKDMVKEFVKQECNYCTQVSGRLVTRSLAKASRDEMTAFIKRLYELCEFYGLTDYKLTGAEKKALVEYYNKL